MDLELFSAAIFYSLLALVLYWKRDRLTRMSKVIIAIKSKKGISLMEKLARHRRLVKVISTIFLPIAFYFMFVVMSQIVLGVYSMFMTPDPQPAVAFVIPGIRIPGSPLFFPFWHTILAIVIVAAVHEFSHGVVAISEDVPIESAGFGIFFIFFIAFVNPEEEKMKSAKKLSQTRIAAAGPASNIVMAFLLFLLISSLDPLVAGNFDFTGVSIQDVMEGYPAQEAGLEPGMTITGINNTPTDNITSFMGALSAVEPNATVPVYTRDLQFNVTLAPSPENESMAYLGVMVEQEWNYREKSVFSEAGFFLFGLPYFRLSPYERGLLWWTAFISFFVGIMNLLPIFGLDGGIILYSLLGYIVEDESKRNKIATWVFTFFITSLLLIIVLPYVL